MKLFRCLRKSAIIIQVSLPVLELEAILITLISVCEAIIEFQMWEEPTLHKILPSCHYCNRELTRIEVSGEVVDEIRMMRHP